MSLTLDTIKGKCAKQEEFEAGIALKRQVTLESVQSFWKGEISVQASVQEPNMPKDMACCHKVRFSLEKEEYQSWHCSCMKAGKSLCRHIVAASLAYYKMLQGKQTISTSLAMRRIVKGYQKQEMLAAEKGCKEKVQLIPVLSIIEGKGKLGLRIGNSYKYYMVKNLTEFYFHMEARDTVKYGKYLELVHVKEVFLKESLPLLEFIMGAIENELRYYRQYYPGRVETGLKCREIELSKEMTERFFKMYIGKQLVVVENGWEREVKVLEKNPEFHICLKKEWNGYTMNWKESVTLLEGENRLYLIDGGYIYCTSPEFTKDMFVFIKEWGAYGKQNSCQIGIYDMPGVCGQVLPYLLKWVQFDAKDIDLEQYKPRPVEAIFSFDVNAEGAITCEETLLYGDFSFNPVKGNSVPVTIYRDYPGEYRIRKIVEDYFKYYDLESGLLLLSQEEEIFRLIDTGIEEFMQVGTVYLSERLKTIQVVAPPKPFIGVSLKGDMLDLTIDLGGVPKEELSGLLENYRLKKKFYRLRKGEFLKIEDTALSVLFEAADGLSLPLEGVEKQVSIPAYHALYLDQVLADNRINSNRNDGFCKLIEICNNNNDFELPKGFCGTLREYQKVGYGWLRTLSQCGFGGILADEMGLGKTIQVIALLLSVKEELSSPALIICPASLVYNWEKEIKHFAPGLDVLVISGNVEERENIFTNQRKEQIWVTSYDLLKRDIQWYETMKFSYQVIDEAQMIKNYSTQVTKAVKAIKSQHRFALTGTPMENRLSELWSIFDYLMKGYLYSYSHFREKIELPIIKEGDGRASLRLKKLLKPFILRRLKKEVLKDLPEKLETIVYSRMDGEQKLLYMAYVAKIQEELGQSTPEEYQEGKIQILAALTRLRQICCDPALCYENYKGDSAKLNTCMELIEEGLGEGHRFLLFSQFTGMLGKIKEELEKRKIPCFILTGGTLKQERLEMSERFNKGEGKVFLISLKAGGTGLNLIGADMVIHYDPWWNVAAQHQATDRAHRIGQGQIVTEIKLVAQGTIEENILHLQERKQRLSEEIIDGANSGLSSITKEELLEILNEI